MECPICFSQYDETDRVPLRSFCKCNKTLCLMCIENMIKNNAYCPWDKTRWSGRNLMQKFFNNTPDKYLEILQLEHANTKGPDVVSSPFGKVSHLGSGELRNEYMKQQQIEQERFQAQHAEQLQLDKDLALQIEAAEATERLAQLKTIEEQDRKLAETLAAALQSNRQPVHGQIKRNLIVESLERQRSLSNNSSISNEPIYRTLSAQKTTAVNSSVFLSAPHEDSEVRQISSGSLFGVSRSLVSSGSSSSLATISVASSSSSSSSTNKEKSGHHISNGNTINTSIYHSIQPSSFYNNNRTISTKSSHSERFSVINNSHPSPSSTTSSVVAITRPISIFRPDYKRAAVEISPSRRPVTTPAVVVINDVDGGDDDLTDCEEMNSSAEKSLVKKRQRSQSEGEKEREHSIGESDGWCCAACTFLNNRYLTRCELCDQSQGIR